MSAFRTVAAYETRMLLRKSSLWIVTGLTVVLLVVLTQGLMAEVLTDEDPKTIMVLAAFQANLLLPIAFGCLLADRWVRDDRLGVTPLLDATPTGAGARLAGKYAGTCLAGTAPIALAFLAFAVGYAAWAGRPVALAWALAAFALIIAPALLFVAAFALAVPLMMPAPLFRVLFVGYWFWGNGVDPGDLPTLAGTLVYPIGGYAVDALFDYHGPQGDVRWAGPVPGAVLNVLRPEPTPAVAWLSIAVLLALAAAVLVVAHRLRTRTHRS
jgi:hypothetical protein